ncbi:hypothetical protein EWH99_10310 [Sporolactobacillus sp. THM7-7]|nr:hypothetical protein EWH99_10310 [Sporolactobacillus sp. THM7-7]
MKPYRDLTVYNIIFPIFMFYISPTFFGLAAAFNLIIDALVLFAFLRFFNIKLKRRIPLLMQLWGIGLLADVLGSFVLLLAAVGGKWLPIPVIDEYAIYSSPLSILTFCVAILISAQLIYWLDLKVLKRRLTVNQSRRIALVFAIVTAPYTFLIPTVWFL